MVYKLNINDRAALAIKNKTKRVEIRANKKGKINYSKISSNDIIEFTSNNLGVFFTKVKEFNYYKTLKDLFTLEGTKYTTSSTDDYDEAIKNVYKLDGYEESIKSFGVYAIHIEYLYSENTIWDELYEKAKNVRNGRQVSKMISAGGVGVCIDTSCSLGMCAERNAIANMITNGEKEILKLVCIDSRGEVGSPCGACREYLMQLSKNSKDIEILMDEKTKEFVKLEELIPDWWGYDRV